MRRIKYFGGQQETLPIKKQKQLESFMFNLIKKIEQAKTDNKRYLAYRNWILCLIGFNTAFRAEDLLQLRVKDIKKGYVSIKENKTGKMQNFRMNKQLHQDILKYIDTFELTDSDYMFMGQKKKETKNGKTYNLIYPITRQQAHSIVTKNAEQVNIDFKFGLHSLRKTLGYFYIKNGGKPDTLMKMYNHDDYNVTMRYVSWGIDDAESDREAMYLGGVHK